jgi:hypothetical protein
LLWFFHVFAINERMPCIHCVGCRLGSFFLTVRLVVSG